MDNAAAGLIGFAERADNLLGPLLPGEEIAPACLSATAYGSKTAAKFDDVFEYFLGTRLANQPRFGSAMKASMECQGRMRAPPALTAKA